MSTLRLYEISSIYLEAMETLAEMDDLPPGAISDTLEGLAGEFSQKATAVAAYVRNLEEEAAVIAAAQQRMDQRRQALVNHANRLRYYLKDEMERTGLLKITSAELAMRIQKNPPHTVITDEASLPAEFKQEVVSVKILKTKIGLDLKAGKHIPGAYLEQGTRLVIS